jgi:hypothetical protein
MLCSWEQFWCHEKSEMHFSLGLHVKYDFSAFLEVSN